MPCLHATVLYSLLSQIARISQSMGEHHIKQVEENEVCSRRLFSFKSSNQVARTDPEVSSPRRIVKRKRKKVGHISKSCVQVHLKCHSIH